MPTIPIYQIDAFAKETFAGNPAAVCPLENWLDDDILIAIAAENNLSETAFIVPKGEGYHIRWFTPTQEVQLCGHATLASAFVIMTELDKSRRDVEFDSFSGPLYVSRDGDRFTMDFPAWRLEPVDAQETLVRGLGGEAPTEIWVVDSDDNYYAVYDSEDQVRALQPDFELLKELHPAGVVVTAPGDESDCASRYFAPSYGINEDPATGSIHCGLAPYWCERLDKDSIHAKQVSQRGADLWCQPRGDRVMITGHAVKYLQGTISL